VHRRAIHDRLGPFVVWVEYVGRRPVAGPLAFLILLLHRDANFCRLRREDFGGSGRWRCYRCRHHFVHDPGWQWSGCCLTAQPPRVIETITIHAMLNRIMALYLPDCCLKL
jgi:hypothetical protein